MRRSVVLCLSLLMASCGSHQSKSSTQSSDRTQNSADVQKSGDGPFGLPLSGALADFNLAKDTSDLPKGVHVLASVPSPDPAVESYVIEYHEGVGLCRIRAIGPTNSNDDAGIQVKTQIDGLSDALSEKYGKPQSLDRCSGGVTCEGQFWAQAVQGGERYYMNEWKPSKGKISRVNIEADASNGISTYFALEYRIGSINACDKARNKEKSSNL